MKALITISMLLSVLLLGFALLDLSVVISQYYKHLGEPYDLYSWFGVSVVGGVIVLFWWVVCLAPFKKHVTVLAKVSIASVHSTACCTWHICLYIYRPVRNGACLKTRKSNPTVERDWPKAALFMACGNLNILGYCHIPWSASPSLPR